MKKETKKIRVRTTTTGNLRVEPRICFFLPEADNQGLKDYAGKERIPVAQLMRRITHEWLESNKEQ